MRHGVVAVTKSDVADPGRAARQARALVPGAEVVPVSARRGPGRGRAAGRAGADGRRGCRAARGTAEGEPRLHVDRSLHDQGRGHGGHRHAVVGRRGAAATTCRWWAAPAPCRVRSVQVHDAGRGARGRGAAGGAEPGGPVPRRGRAAATWWPGAGTALAPTRALRGRAGARTTRSWTASGSRCTTARARRRRGSAAAATGAPRCGWSSRCCWPRRRPFRGAADRAAGHAGRRRRAGSPPAPARHAAPRAAPRPRRPPRRARSTTPRWRWRSACARPATSRPWTGAGRAGGRAGRAARGGTGRARGPAAALPRRRAGARSRRRVRAHLDTARRDHRGAAARLAGHQPQVRPGAAGALRRRGPDPAPRRRPRAAPPARRWVSR